ncbi:MAG TPA: ClcB-like voltage-gated chloride channel protein [Candidatus Krumholzibacteria bacterium]|nr:ClcB-like voltage-gated chloride channel protein [Candidatus Krumholzibacteria bacterium]HPD71800.1 ClcB-like voltage-gated chloride channel protein [Candidatus Krumholzibacteria bacterium]HRY41267.1 ClcB-like voltage-gated chloride channel protein [Candidatus Krumholzibacteria bacterium]
MRITTGKLDRTLRHWRLGPRLLRLLRLRIWLFDRFRFTDVQQILFWAGIVGVAGGFSSLLLRDAMGYLHQLLTGQSGELVESFARLGTWQRLAIPSAGAVAAGIVIHFGRRLRTDGTTTDYMEAVALGTGVLSVRSSVVKVVSSAFSVASGASIGREGPIVQLASLVSSLPGRLRSWSPPRRRVIVACGAAAGIASAYNAPIAGALFVSEIMLKSIAMETLGPLVFSSVLATQVVRQVHGHEPLYTIPPFTMASGWELVLYLVLGVVCGLLAPVFLRLLRGSERLFGSLRMPPFVSLGLGGLAVGAIAVRYPEVCGNGYSVIVSILNDAWVWQALLAVLALKVAATCASFGSGAVGGVFTPTLFAGAGIGYLFGGACDTLLAGAGSNPGAYALVGMGMFIAATTRAPLTAILIVFEMTLDYQVVVPLMLGCVVAYYTSTAIDPRSIYSHSLARKTGPEVRRQIASLLVSDLMKAEVIVVRLGSHFSEIARSFIANNIKYLYVLDDADVFRGVVPLQETKSYLTEPHLADVVIAHDIMQEEFPILYPDSTLDEALETFARHDGERLPVVERETRQLLGRVAKADVLFALAHRQAS